MIFAQPGFLCEQNHSHQKRSQKRKLTIFGNTKQVIQDYTTQYLTIRFPSAKMTHYGLRISKYRVSGLHFVPWHRGSGCDGLGAAAPVTGAAADEYNLNVVDCNASVTVARRSSISVSGGLGVPPAAGGKRKIRACWGFFFFLNSNEGEDGRRRQLIAERNRTEGAARRGPF